MKKQVISLVLALVLLSSGFNLSYGEKLGFREEKVEIPAGDHSIPGILVLPTFKGEKKAGAVLMLHGWASDKNEVGNMYKDLAEDLAKKGVASLRIDFAGSGDSSQAYELNNQNQSVADGQKALNYLLTHEKIDPAKVGLLGFSQGGAIAQTVAAREPQLKALATWSTARANGEEDLSDEAKEAKEKGFVMVESFRGDLKQSREFYEARENARGLDELRRNFHGPLLVLAGEKDEVVNPDISKELINSVDSNNKTLRIFKEGDHIFNVLSDNKSVSQRALNISSSWFVELLK